VWTWLPLGGTLLLKRKNFLSARPPSDKEISQIRRRLESSPDFEQAVALLKLGRNSTRLKILHILDGNSELKVSDLAKIVGLSASAVSEHLAKLRDYGLVESQRRAQSFYYRQTESKLNELFRKFLD